jgi:hypothetical protein
MDDAQIYSRLARVFYENPGKHGRSRSTHQTPRMKADLERNFPHHGQENGGECGESVGSEIKSLASSALDLNQLIKLAKVIGKAFFRGQITSSAGTLPARSSEQLDCRHGCAGTRRQRRAAWHRA